MKIAYRRIETMTWASLGNCFDWLVVLVFSLLCSPPCIGKNEAIVDYLKKKLWFWIFFAIFSGELKIEQIQSESNFYYFEIFLAVKFYTQIYVLNVLL